jgi:hypothetical protein
MENADVEKRLKDFERLIGPEREMFIRTLPYNLRREMDVDDNRLLLRQPPKVNVNWAAVKKKVAWTAAALGVWYMFNTQPQDLGSVDERYPLPTQIVVSDSSIPYTVDSQGEKVVQVKDIDFSADKIDITTDRYHFVKDKDWTPLWLIGQPLSCFSKLYFWDHNIGWGADADRTKALLAMVENDKMLTNITVRVNRNAPFQDLYRLFTEPSLIERNPFLARATIGVFDVVKSGAEAYLYRGDYYNPFTRTAVVYSNVESIGAHEMGHAKDFQRFDYDWVYALSRPLTPVMLYQEWRASQNAKGILSEQDQWQFNRYLVPAFCTYLYISWVILKKGHKKFMEEREKQRKKAMEVKLRDIPALVPTPKRSRNKPPEV